MLGTLRSERRTHLACAGPSVGEDDYPRAAPTRVRVVASNGLEHCECQNCKGRI